jgi:AhpD family alkylhydroperoxidase
MATTQTIEPRIPDIAGTVPDALQAMLALSKAAAQGGVPPTTHHLVHLRASQINGCSLCVELHGRELREAGEPDARIRSVAVWREGAALALAEAATRLAGRPDPVSDEVWVEAARHYDDALASLVISIAAIHARNRLDVTTRQPAGSRS